MAANGTEWQLEGQPGVYFRTPQGSHRHVSWNCANGRRSVLNGYPEVIPADEAAGWAPCEFCCQAAEFAEFAAQQTARDAEKCPNTGVASTRRLYSTCVDCGRQGAVTRAGTLRAHAPLTTPAPAGQTEQQQTAPGPRYWAVLYRRNDKPFMTCATTDGDRAPHTPDTVRKIIEIQRGPVQQISALPFPTREQAQQFMTEKKSSREALHTWTALLTP